MSNNKPVYVILTGGLGNQLFQVAAALDFSKGNPIYVDWKSGSPRLNEIGLPEIASFNLPPNIIFLDNKRTHLISKKAFGFLLRVGLSPRKYQQNHLFALLTTLAGSLVYSLRFRTLVRISLSQSLGFERLISGKLSRVLIGYFQSYIWTENTTVLNGLLAIRSIEVNAEYLELEKSSARENPLIVHLRFGDYKNEPHFGVLTKDYYVNAVKLATHTREFGAIWVFSDEMKLARQLINFEIDLPIRFIENLGNSTATNFDAMRLGHGYIIANSSYSWWAARLSRNRVTLVIAPKPWFIGVDDDQSLIPPFWKTLSGHGL